MYVAATTFSLVHVQRSAVLTIPLASCYSLLNFYFLKLLNNNIKKTKGVKNEIKTAHVFLNDK